ncbi:MAG: S-layer homology domain-containing protein, partial [Thermacetogeniaceae bacterium]
GSTGASLSGSILTPVAAGSGQVTASIGDVTSNPVDYKVIVQAAQNNTGGGGGGATPTVQTTLVNDITSNSAVLGGSITNNGGVTIVGYGFLWGTFSDSLGNILQAGTDSHAGSFTVSLSGLQAGMTYYFQAYAKSSGGLYKGEVKQFTTIEVPPPVPAPVFADVLASYWAFDAINDLSIHRYVYGYPDGTFKPDSIITRAEFVCILNRALELRRYNYAMPDYNDIFSGQWFYSSVENATRAGIVYGYGNEMFAPDKPITREEMACMLVQAMGRTDEAKSKMGLHTGFVDDGNISWWSRGFVVVAVEYGLIGYPDHIFRPGAETTRAEACAMIEKLLNVHG